MNKKSWIDEILSFSIEGVKLLKSEFFPMHIGKVVFFSGCTLVVLFFFFVVLLFAAWELLQLLSIPSWGASLCLVGVLLLVLFFLIRKIRKEMNPKRRESKNRPLTVNDVAIAFLDGLLNGSRSKWKK